MQRNIMRLLSLAVQIKISDGLMPFKKSRLRPLQNALPVAPAQAGAQYEAQLQLSGR